MSLINKVSAIIDNKVPLKDLTYSQPFVYESGQGILSINWKNILPKPPANDSITTKKELDLVIEAAANRSNKATELVYKVDDDPLHLFYDFLEKKKLEYNRSLFDEYYNILESYVYATKYHYNRPRPEQIAPYYNQEVKVIYTSTHQTPAYPSGHTAYAALAAHMLSKKFPEYKKQFFDLAKQSGTARILQGVHFPSDNVAGMTLAKFIFKEIERKVQNVSKRTKTYPSDYTRTT
jgi:hypothetical protein